MAVYSYVSPVDSSVPGAQYINGILSGDKWADKNITYSFPQSGNLYEQYYSVQNEPSNGFQAFNAVQQAAVRTVLGMFAAVANLKFTEVTETSQTSGQFRFGFTSYYLYAEAWSYGVSSSGAGGDIWVPLWVERDFVLPKRGSFGFYTLLHEVGHSLGLKHSFEI